MNLNRRISELEQGVKPNEPELFYNAMTPQQFDRFGELLEKMDAGDQITEAENTEAHELFELAQIDSKKVFLEQYEKQPPHKLRTIFNDFADYQAEMGFLNSYTGNPLTPAYPAFGNFLDEHDIEYTP